MLLGTAIRLLCFTVFLLSIADDESSVGHFSCVASSRTACSMHVLAFWVLLGMPLKRGVLNVCVKHALAVLVCKYGRVDVIMPYSVIRFHVAYIQSQFGGGSDVQKVTASANPS